MSRHLDTREIRCNHLTGWKNFVAKSGFKYRSDCAGGSLLHPAETLEISRSRNHRASIGMDLWPLSWEQTSLVCHPYEAGQLWPLRPRWLLDLLIYTAPPA